MKGVIVVHDEFRGMGVSGCGAVVVDGGFVCGCESGLFCDQNDVRMIVVLIGAISGMMISNGPFSPCNDTFKCQRN